MFVFVVLTTFLVHRKSHESPDTGYDTEAALRRIEAKVDGLEKKVAKSPSRKSARTRSARSTCRR